MMMGELEELRNKILELEGLIKNDKLEPITKEEIDKICSEL